MDGTQDQTETHDQPKIPAKIPAEIPTKITTEVKKERIKNPKRVEQGKKLAEWNKENKKRLSRQQLETQSETPPLQLEDEVSQPLQLKDETQQLKDEALQLEVKPLKENTKLSTKSTKSKDYFIIAETILIISLVGAGLFFYTTTTQKCSNKAQLKAGKAPDANIATKSNEASLQTSLQTTLQTSQMKMIILKCNFKKNIYFILYKMDPNSIVNNAYHSAVLSGLVITNSVLATKLLTIKSVDLGKFSVKDGAMLSANIYVAMMIKSALIKQGILPPSINIPT